MNVEKALEILKTTSPLRITVSGDIGSGKSTFTTKLAETLEIPRVYIGGLMREEAKKRGITLDELNALLEKDDTIDRQMDAMQKDVSKTTEKGIFEGRTAWYFVENPSVRVFLAVSPLTSATRIATDKNASRDTYQTVEEVMAANEARKRSEIERYQTYYGIDAYNTANFDVIIDTSTLSIDEVFAQTVIAIAEFLLARNA